MKGTENFKATIQNHLNGLAANDPLFSEILKKPKKNIDDCINYIFNTVKDSGCSGFADEEIFGMAVHYYDEDNIVPGKPLKASVVVNHSIELSDEERQHAKQQAIDKVIQEEKEKMKLRKAGKKPESTTTVATLFD